MRNCKYIIVIGILVSFVGVVSLVTVLAQATNADNQPKVPFKYALGQNKYLEMCSACHGEWGDGSDQGPPLMHAFYKPSHHGDPSFYRAALKGVQAHHWNFGDMPPVEGATSRDLDVIVPFIRWLQREKCIYQ